MVGYDFINGGLYLLNDVSHIDGRLAIVFFVGWSKSSKKQKPAVMSGHLLNSMKKVILSQRSFHCFPLR